MKSSLMSLYDIIMLRKREVIETVNDELKTFAILITPGIVLLTTLQLI